MADRPFARAPGGICIQATQEGELIARQTDTLRRGTVSRRDMTNNPSPSINLLDSVGGPNIFADNAARWFLLNGNIHITLEAALADPVTSAGPINRVIVGRLIMPLNKAEEMATGLLDFIQQMKAQASTLPGGQGLLEIS
jgi:hypothetical protein